MIETVQKYIEKLFLLISNRPIPFHDNLHACLPSEGGVYRIFRDSSDWRASIYVGETGNLLNRIYSNLLMGDSQAHTLNRKLIGAGFTDKEAVKHYLKNNCRVQYLEISNEKERDSFEHFAISILKPKYND